MDKVSKLGVKCVLTGGGGEGGGGEGRDFKKLI